jgi:drug/metabolite transporter (DMT)-like permease
MEWVGTAILSALILGFVNTVDSHLIAKRLPSFRAYLLPVGAMMLLLSLVMVLIFPFRAGVGVWPWVAAITAGILRSTAIIIMLYAMRREEVSQVIPIVNTYPIFVAIIAMPILGEMLDFQQWLAIVIVVTGVVLVSLKKGPGTGLTSMGRMALTLVGSSMIMAVADVAAKYSLDYFSSWNLYCFTHFSLSAMLLLMGLRPSVLSELHRCRTRNSSLIIIFVNEIIGVAGVVLFYLAMQSGPVSLVSTIFSSRPLFVLLFAVIIRGFVTMIVAGLAIIYLS